MYTSLDDSTPYRQGSQSAASQFDTKWTVLNLNRIPPPHRCCHVCNPLLNVSYAVKKNDPRLTAYDSEFIFPLVTSKASSQCPDSALSVISMILNTSSNFTPLPKNRTNKLSDYEASHLQKVIIDWHNNCFAHAGSLFSCQVMLPPKQVDALVLAGVKFLETTMVARRDIQRATLWDSATDDDLDSLIEVIHKWREDAMPQPTPRATPQSQRRSRKKARPDMTEQTPQAPPPSFTLGLPQHRASVINDRSLALTDGMCPCSIIIFCYLNTYREFLLRHCEYTCALCPWRFSTPVLYNRTAPCFTVPTPSHFQLTNSPQLHSQLGNANSVVYSAPLSRLNPYTFTMSPSFIQESFTPYPRQYQQPYHSHANVHPSPMMFPLTPQLHPQTTRFIQHPLSNSSSNQYFPS